MEDKKIVSLLSVGRDMKGECRPVLVEVMVTKGIGIHIVGLADSCVKESLLRTVTAIQALGYSLPGKKIVVNVAPNDIHKTGTGYDLPIALGILLASEQINIDTDTLKRCVFQGELALDGSIRTDGTTCGYGYARAVAAQMGTSPKVLATSVATAIQAGAQTQVLPLGFDHLKQVIDCLANHPHAEGYIIWNRPEWNLVEDNINRLKDYTVIL